MASRRCARASLVHTVVASPSRRSTEIDAPETGSSSTKGAQRSSPLGDTSRGSAAPRMERVRHEPLAIALEGVSTLCACRSHAQRPSRVPSPYSSPLAWARGLDRDLSVRVRCARCSSPRQRSLTLNQETRWSSRGLSRSTSPPCTPGYGGRHRVRIRRPLRHREPAQRGRRPAGAQRGTAPLRERGGIRMGTIY